MFYRPQRSCEGYVFTPVSLSTGGSASVHAGISPPPGGRHRGSASVHAGIPPPGQTPPGADTPRNRHTLKQTATVADGAHPTGIHSCVVRKTLQSLNVTTNAIVTTNRVQNFA